MSSLPEIPEALLPALKIFFDEFVSHNTSFAELIPKLDQDNTAEDLSETKYGLKHRFHTIRGSAGFFQLHEISELAHRAEKLCSGEELEPKPLAVELKRIVESLNASVSDLQTHFKD